MMNTSPEINEIATALAKAQAKIETASKDGKNPHFNRTYATLSSVWDACREPLSSNNLAVLQTTEQDENGINLITRLAHSSGQWVQGVIPIRGVRNDMQGLGSGLTYARRYGLMGIVGISPADDDGEDGKGGKDANFGKGKGKDDVPLSDTKDGHGADPNAERDRILGMCKGLKKRINDAQNLNALEAIMHDANMDLIAAHDQNWWAAIEAAAHERRTALFQSNVNTAIGEPQEENPFQ